MDGCCDNFKGLEVISKRICSFREKNRKLISVLEKKEKSEREEEIEITNSLMRKKSSQMFNIRNNSRNNHLWGEDLPPY
jgi:hypothetical protein